MRIALLAPWLIAFGSSLASSQGKEKALIDFTDLNALRRDRPLILILHRGGVVEPGSPQCSLEAIRRAAQAGYDMVELDVRCSKDSVPIFYHDPTFRALCGDNRVPRDLTAAEIFQIRFKETQAPVASIDEAMALCKDLGLGVQLDIKDAQEDEATKKMMQIVADLVIRHGLDRATITISNGPAFIDQALAGKAMFTMSPGEFRERLDKGEEIKNDRFIFAGAKDLPDDLVQKMLERGFLIFPSINTHHYALETTLDKTRSDIERLQACGVPGLQIDSLYVPMVKLPPSPQPATAKTEGKALSDIHLRDPFILPVPEENLYYLYGTCCHLPNGTGFDAYTSSDLVRWQGPFPVFRPDPGFWSDRDFWAPEVHKVRGRYYLFASFKAQNKARGTQILAADHPRGPFLPHSLAPITPPDWECLDGTLTVDDAGAPWMVFCHEWLQVQDGEICAVRMDESLKRPAEAPRLLFKASEASWVQRGPTFVTDAPFLHRMGNGELIMFWSSFGKSGYAWAVARSKSGSIEGPWVQDQEPIFTEDGGHGMLFQRLGDGQLMAVLHAPNRGPLERPRLFSCREDGGAISLIPEIAQ